MSDPTALTRSPLLGLRGAVEADGDDAGVAAHYGEPVREQRMLAAGDALVDLSHRAVLAVSGVDRLTWLDSLTSQRLTGLEPGDSAETLLLDPSGRIEHAAAVLDDGTTAWLVLERAEGPGLAAFLDRMRFMLRVEVADATDRIAVLGAFGDRPELSTVVGAPPLVWRDPWHEGAAGGATTARGAHPGADWPFRLLLVPRAELGAVAAAARTGSVAVAGLLALEALRVAAWRPRRAREADERTIPQELDWLRSAVHLSKGCYRGQETVAKVYNLGRPPRRLVQLDLDGSDDVLPAAGDAVLAGDAVVGTITTAARHHELGPVALAVVKRSVPAGEVLTVRAEGALVAAAQQQVVPADGGPAVAVPRLPRLGQVTRSAS